jgi:hypothetical protein
VDCDPVLIPPLHEEALVDALSIFPTYWLYRETNDWIALTRDVLVELGTARGRIGARRAHPSRSDIGPRLHRGRPPAGRQSVDTTTSRPPLRRVF